MSKSVVFVYCALTFSMIIAIGGETFAVPKIVSVTKQDLSNDMLIPHLLFYICLLMVGTIPFMLSGVIMVINVNYCFQMVKEYYNKFYAKRYENNKNNHILQNMNDMNNIQNNNLNYKYNPMSDILKFCETINMDRINDYNLYVYPRVKYIQHVIKIPFLLWLGVIGSCVWWFVGSIFRRKCSKLKKKQISILLFCF